MSQSYVPIHQRSKTGSNKQTYMMNKTFSIKVIVVEKVSDFNSGDCLTFLALTGVLKDWIYCWLSVRSLDIGKILIVSFDWLVVLTPLKNINQLGWLFPIYGKIKAMFQTTNQLILCCKIVWVEWFLDIISVRFPSCACVLWGLGLHRYWWGCGVLKNHLVKDVSVHFLLHFIHIYIYSRAYSTLDYTRRLVFKCFWVWPRKAGDSL